MSDDDILKLFGAKLRTARKRKGLTQAEVAQLMPTTQAWISEAERGLVNPPLLTIERFAATVGHNDFTYFHVFFTLLFGL